VPRLCDVGVLYVELWVVYMGVRHEKWMESYFIGKCSWLWMNVDNGGGQCTPTIQKTANVMPHLKVAPVVYHLHNLYWFVPEGAHLNTKWGVLQLQCSFFRSGTLLVMAD
jgi:hypothetical protein